ncbi:MAG: hypothetical protein JW726_18695, partial [Anaerolineales bacterium]|nr:hypothetical protein [Anaerolineales bacterium]
VVRDITTPEASVAVVTAGIIPYYSERPAIDFMGKCDAYIARQPMHLEDNLPLIDVRPGHMKWDYSYSITVLQPDVIAQLWDGYDNPDTLALMTNYTKVVINDFPLFLRNDSPYILWDEALSQE